MNSIILFKAKKIRRVSQLRIVNIGRMIIKKTMSTGISYWMLGLRVNKLEQCEALLVARTEHPSITAWPYDISGLIIDTATNVVMKGVVCGINLL